MLTHAACCRYSLGEGIEKKKAADLGAEVEEQKKAMQAKADAAKAEPAKEEAPAASADAAPAVKARPLGLSP